METQYLVIASLVFVLLLLARVLYWRVPQGMGYIRSGWGGQQVILEGGSLVIPGFHRIAGMKLNNFTLDVEATRKQSLLTKDPLRVDIDLRLLARVKSEADMVMMARNVFDGDPEQINELLEKRCLSVMKTVAGEMTLETLLRSTATFESGVYELLNEELAKLGLEVILVSVTEVQQTSQLDYQRSRSVDAKALAVLEGMRTESIRTLHAKVREAELQMKKLDFEAAVKKLEWDEQYAAARLEHQRQKAGIEARLTQELREIEASRQLAAAMVEQDTERMLLQFKAA